MACPYEKTDKILSYNKTFLSTLGTYSLVYMHYNSDTLPSIVFQATSLHEKFRFRFFPTLRLQFSTNSSSSMENTLKTANQKFHCHCYTSELKYYTAYSPHSQICTLWLCLFTESLWQPLCITLSHTCVGMQCHTQ